MYDLINELDTNNIRLSVSGDELEVSFDTPEIDPEILQKIKDNKTALITFIKQDSGVKEQKIPTIEKKDRYRCSSAQQRLWIQLKLDGNSSIYNIPNTIELHGDICIEVLVNSIEKVIDRHEILRTVFIEENSALYQKVLTREELDFKVNIKDLTKEEKPYELVKEYTSKDTFLTFDLEKGPAIRITLFIVSDTQLVLYCNMHHIISDGVSMQILERDIKVHYKALSDKTEIELPELKIQYKDYSAWQFDQISGSKFDIHKKYWLEKLNKEWTYLDFPFRKKNKQVRTNAGESIRTYLSAENTKKLKTYVQQHKGSNFIGLLSICKILLHRYTNQRDIIVGTAVNGRDHADLENQIGFYVNTLILRNLIEPKSSFNTIFEEIKDSTLSAFTHKFFPFDKLLEFLDIERDVTRNSIFDVFINYNSNSITSNKRIAEEKIEFLGSSPAKFDLSIIFEEVGEHLLFHISYNTNIYDRWMIEEFMEQYMHLLSSLLKLPDEPIGKIDLLSEEKKRELLYEFNNTDISYDKEKTILDYFQENVEKKPDSVALIFEDKQLTYQELDKTTTQLCGLLKNKGIEIGDFLPICIDRSLEMIIGILGAMKSGACYVPIEPSYPQERINHILEEIDAKLLLSKKSVSIPNANIERVDLDNFSYEDYDDMPTKIDQDTLAYTIYTSGTTGNPKGVMNTHRGMMNRLLWQQDYLGLNSSDTFLLKTPYTFDVSVWEIFLPLLCGSALVITPPEGHKNPYHLSEIIKKNKVTIIHFVPSMLGIYMQSIKQNSFDAIRNVICSGEELTIGLVEEFRKLSNGTRIHNLYGPTEAAIDVTAIDLTESILDKGVSIGKPVANTKMYIINEYNQLVPKGAIGEIVIGGVQVAKGYFKKNKLTSEKFIPDLFSSEGLMYKTGDLGMWLDNGNIYYMGRKDNQVKIRGNRIELREVEQAILILDEITQAVVLAEGDGNEKILNAYLVGKEVSLDHLRGFLRNKLPTFMIPEMFYMVPSIPLSKNGKIDNKTLVRNKGKNLKNNVKFEIPKNEIQEKIITLLRTELTEGIEIGIHDNFFDLGLNSIKLLKFLELINSTFNEEIMPEVLFEYPSVFELSKVLSKVTLEERNVDYGSKVKEMDDFFDMMAD